jgi:hypothetical protein
VVPNNYNDDDIIEDYEELTDESEVKHVESARGGPVDRPTKQVKPSDHVRPGSSVSGVPAGGPAGGPAGSSDDRPKGKITKKQAKLIWIVCIAITVLGLGAVIVDIAVDPLNRHVPQEVGGQQGGAQQNRGSGVPPRRKQEDLSAHQLMAREFAQAANAFRVQAQESDIYEDSWNTLQNALDAQRAAQEERSDEELWAEAWRQYLQAAYLVELFHHLHAYDDRDLPLVSNLRDYAAMEDMTEEELQSESIQSALGFYTAHQTLRNQVDGLRRTFREIAVSNNVFNRDEYKEELGALRERLENAGNNGEFDEEDLARYGQ